MIRQRGRTDGGTMLELWRPPQNAGDPVGCLATTYTFAPGLFDEQCLARFLDIESEPNREDLAFLLERESRLGSVYAGVLVDYTQAGVEHSLRWDVLPVRIRSGKQHAKLSLLAWSRHVRIVVASANLTEPGYRSNREVAAAVDLTPDDASAELMANAATFLRRILLFVPGALTRPPEVRRAEGFVDQVERQVQGWKGTKRRRTVRQQLVFTLPAMGAGRAARSTIEEAIHACRGRGGSPDEAWVASPFFDADSETSRVAASLCKSMARGRGRILYFCVPAIRDNDEPTILRLAAPKALIRTPLANQDSVRVGILPAMDEDKNPRPWHAKMLALISEQYSALMIGSSNFTCAGMGVGQHRNAEANLLTIVDRRNYSREVGKLEAVWSEMEDVEDPDSAEWMGAQPDNEEEEQASIPPLPPGFLSATYCAGEQRRIILRFDSTQLPEDWHIHACGQKDWDLLMASAWKECGRPQLVEIPWAPAQPPDKLLVRWADHEAFLPLNVEDSRDLPPPAQLDHMSADDMLWILAAADPSAAFRAWATQQQPSGGFNEELDSAIPIDLDPLRRYDLQATFLHRIRHRARVLAQLRQNLQRPVWGRQALEWRLRGLIGIEALSHRLVRDFAEAAVSPNEALLTLSDFLMVLREVDYQPSDGALPKAEHEKIFRPFLGELANKLQQQVETHRDRVSEDLMQFWERVVQVCQE